ncbi:tetratricopeptide repeat protein [Limnobacter sp.]|uniref:tetratricopeptide repeat protein n=1 Tax=Limnobacter sp. TaxID=2003368 RepID=UPI0027342E6D|nr:tetratricopeptide repeat protein [Limnobacter sp.]MDP3188435.1 tetratricopeptide repeat protein [Limnobacter sp.]
MNRYRMHNWCTPWLMVLLAIGVFAAAQNAHAQAEYDEGIRVYKALLPKAEAGDAEVQTTLGMMRLRGDVVPRDLKVARVWLGKAAVQDHTPAQYYLGQLLMLDVFGANASDLHKQLAEGLGWLRKASREQHQPSQLLYAKTLLQSTLERPYGHSKVEAQQHLNACAETHLQCTRFALELLDNNQQEAYCPKSDLCEQKKRLLYMLANAEDSHARYRLSKFEGEDRMFWLRRAARLGHPQASFELAERVLNNQVPLQPEDPAVLTLLNSAAQQGVIEAMHLLGSLLHEGTRFPVNKPLGLQWLNLAAQRGHEPSKQLLAQLQEPAGNIPANDKVESAQPTESTP